MNVAGANAAAVLDHEFLAELVTLPVAEQWRRLQTEDDAEAALVALTEVCDRMATTEVAAALTASETLVALSDTFDSPRARATTRRARAAVLSHASDYPGALSCCMDAVSIADVAGLLIEGARARIAAVQALAQLGRYDEAIAIGATARDSLVSAGELILAARADVSLGAVYDMQGDHVRALEHYDRALPVLGDDVMMVAQLESNRGIALMGLDQFIAAETAFQAAVASFAALGLDWAAAIAEGNLAYMATRQGRLERAMHHFERARRCVEADDSPGELARLLAEQADAMAALGLTVDAARTYEQALPSLEEHGLAVESAQAMMGLGHVQLRLGLLAEAEVALTEAARRFDRLGLEWERARTDVSRAELLALLGRNDEARVLVQDALEILADRESDQAIARSRLASLNLADGDLDGALTEVSLALPIAERLDLAPLQARLLHLRGLVARERGALNECLTDLRLAIAQVERVRGSLQAERYRAGFLGDFLAVYDDAILAALSLDHPDVASAFAMTEQAKSRVLLDLISGALDLVETAGQKASDPAEARLLADLARVRAELNWHYGADRNASASREQAATDLRRKAILALESQLSDLEDRLAATGGIGGLFAPPIGYEQALDLVPADAALIEYYAAGQEVVAFVLRAGRGHIVRRLATVSDIDDRVRRLQFQIGRAVASAGRNQTPDRAARLLADTQRELRGLFDLLVRPLMPEISEVSRLMVVPHGSMHSIPFAALWDGDAYLIERHEVVVVPSASVLAQLGVRQPAARTTDAVVFGVPDELAPRIAVEAEAVGAVLGVTPVVGDAATVERLQVVARDPRIVHLACHGRFVMGNPMASGLKFADRWLTVRDVYGLRLDASLVTLSACETGKTAVGRGDELLGLVRAFYAAGASSLLISLWVAADDSTTRLMTDFYRGLQRGESPAAALRGAQRAQLAHQAHPVYWAPFTLGGYA